MQSATFLAQQGTFHDHRGHVDQVAQFQQVVADDEIGVKLDDFLTQQMKPALGTYQTLLCPDDTDIVPHEPAQFIPIV